MYILLIAICCAASSNHCDDTPPEPSRPMSQDEVHAEVCKDLQNIVAVQKRAARLLKEAIAMTEQLKNRENEDDKYHKGVINGIQKPGLTRRQQVTALMISVEVMQINLLRHSDGPHYFRLVGEFKSHVSSLDYSAKELRACEILLTKPNVTRDELSRAQSTQEVERSTIARVAASLPDMLPAPPQSYNERLRGYDNMIRGLKERLDAELKPNVTK